MASGIVLTVAAPLALPLIGFAKAGVVAGSIAAGIQSTIGNVAAGSVFAALQSVGATGAVGIATKTVVVAAGGVIGAAARMYTG